MRATERFRVPGNGSFSYLERQFNRDAMNEFFGLSERKDGSECRHAEVILVFHEPVVGPLLLDAGRYRCCGLCGPIDAAEEA